MLLRMGCAWIAAGVLAALTGCGSNAGVLSMLSGAPRPTAVVKGVRFDDLSMQQLSVVFDVAVSNPYDVPLPLGRLDYALSSAGQRFVTGSRDVQGVVPAGGTMNVPLKAAVPFKDVTGVLKSVRPGMLLPYAAELKLMAEAPGVGTTTLPITHEGHLPIPAVPEVSVSRIDWKNLSLANAEAVVELAVKNTNAFPVDLDALRYELSLGGKAIGSSQVAEAAKFNGGQTRALKVPARFSLMNLGAAAWDVVRGQAAEYSLTGEVALQTPYGPLHAPLSRSGRAKLTGG